MNDENLMSLSNVAGGAADELFAAALREVLTNIDDPSTDWKAKRTVLLKIEFVSDENRKAGAVTVSCSTKLAGVRPVQSRIFIGRHEGELAAVEALPQEEMFPTPAAKPEVVR